VGGRAGIVARVLLLALLAVSGIGIALQAWSSVTNYRSSFAFDAQLAAGQPLTNRVVLMVLDGIRVDTVSSMPFLQELAGRGSSGIIRTGVPSLSNPSRTVLVTGAWQEVHGVTNNARFEPPRVDSLFSIAKRVGMPVALAGGSFWRRAFAEHLDPQRTRTDRTSPDSIGSTEDLVAWQQQTCEKDLEFLAQQSAGLLVVGITAADTAGHNFGGLSGEYLRTAAAVDGCIASIAGALDDGATTLIVTSDHGHVHFRGHGGHGGLEEEVVNVPLVLAGNAVRPGQGWRGEQVDVAPTICALLGLPLPSTNQGRVLWQALELTPDAEAAIRAREAEQRAVAAAHLPDSEKLRGEEKRSRSLPALAIFTCLWFAGCGIALSYPGRWLRLLIGVAVYYAVYYALFFAFGMQYSLSAINKEEYLSWYLGKDLATASIAFSVGSAFLLRSRIAADSRMLLDFALLLGSTLAIQTTWVYYQHGLFMQSVMLDLRHAFKAYLDLVQMAAIGAAAPAMALLTWLVARRPAQTEAREETEIIVVPDRILDPGRSSQPAAPADLSIDRD
jgi:hypothetical protein